MAKNYNYYNFLSVYMRLGRLGRRKAYTNCLNEYPYAREKL